MCNKEAILILTTSICEGVRGSAACNALDEERYVHDTPEETRPDGRIDRQTDRQTSG